MILPALFCFCFLSHVLLLSLVKVADSPGTARFLWAGNVSGQEAYIVQSQAAPHQIYMRSIGAFPGLEKKLLLSKNGPW